MFNLDSPNIRVEYHYPPYWMSLSRIDFSWWDEEASGTHTHTHLFAPSFTLIHMWTDEKKKHVCIFFQLHCVYLYCRWKKCKNINEDSKNGLKIICIVNTVLYICTATQQWAPKCGGTTGCLNKISYNNKLKFQICKMTKLNL